MTFRLYAVPTGGDVLWLETHPAVEVSDGAFSVEIGTIQALDAALAAEPHSIWGSRWKTAPKCHRVCALEVFCERKGSRPVTHPESISIRQV